MSFELPARRPSLTSKERRRYRRRSWLRQRLLPLISRSFVVTEEPVLIVSPHQDDEVLGCGGLIAFKRRQKVPVSVVFITDGGQSNGEVSQEQRFELIARRKAEARAALSVLGVEDVNIHFMGYPDGELSRLSVKQQATLQADLMDRMMQIRAGEIFLPHRRDSHPDHEAVFLPVKAALARTNHPSRCYEYPVWLLWSRNRLFDNLHWRDLRGVQRLPLAEEKTIKANAMAVYESQLITLPVGFVDFQLDGFEYFFPSSGG